MTGTEIVGLVPKRTLIEAGRYFLHKQQRSTGVSESELIRMAVKSMGLDELAPFRPEEKVIEYLIAPKGGKNLTDLTCTGFAEETASESPAPGGGSISAYMGALAAALGTMVADQADRGQELMQRLLHLVNEDTEAFNRIMDAFKMPKSTDEEKAARAAAIEDATLYATRIPLSTMEAAAETFPLLESMARTGNPASVSDAGVGALAARSAVLGAQLNVRINAASLKNREEADRLTARAAEIAEKAMIAETKVLEIVNEVLSAGK